MKSYLHAISHTLHTVTVLSMLVVAGCSDKGPFSQPSSAHAADSKSEPVRFRPNPNDPFGMEFEFLGCTGEWPRNLPFQVIVQKENTRNPSFFIRDPLDCGLLVKSPHYELKGNALVLSYTAYASGPVAACYCEYDSRFTFKSLPAQVKNVSLNHN